MSQNLQPTGAPEPPAEKRGFFQGCFAFIAKYALTVLTFLIILGVVFSLARAAIYKIRPYERGLHLRGGSFVGIDQPGWHIQIPFVDTVIGVVISERSAMIENLAAMTADDVTMDISLLYTYRVVDPVQYQLEVLDPDQIVAGFVQGALRDLVNTRKMNDVLHLRAEFNQELLTALKQKEAQYGIEFILVQIQNAAPPTEVVNAIKEKMVAEQLQEKATADATQQRTLADSEFYTAQKKADGEAYSITTLAEAEAKRTALNAEAQAKSIEAILKLLKDGGPLAEQYIQVLIAQELRENSKWVITNGSTLPVLDLSGANTITQPTPAP